MKKFKIIDTWISIILIFSFVVLSFIWRDARFIYGYFVVGGWQMISMIVHTLNNWFCYRGSDRRIYHKVIVWLLIGTLAGIILYPVLFVILVLLLFLAPFMAVYYTYICYDEVYHKMQRPLAQLK